MNQLRVSSQKLNGKIEIPSSKSHTMRGILFGLLGKGKTIIRNPLSSPDVEFMLQACQLFGSHINKENNALIIDGLNGQLFPAADVINCGNSGQVLRFLGALSALSSFPTVFTGDHSIRHQRPIKPLLEGLNQWGAKAFSLRGNDYAPIFVQGPLRSGFAEISGEDSQPVSGLLMAAVFSDGPFELKVINPGEKPWVNVTLSWFERLNLSFTQKDFSSYKIQGNQFYEGFDYSVPGDFSSAAFPIAAALVTDSEITLKNVDMEDCQGDKKLIDALQKMGAQISYDSYLKELNIKKGKELKAIHIDINDFIDAITILAVIACFAEGETHITNAAIARNKECDRIHCTAIELRRMGADIEETAQGLIVRRSMLYGAEVFSHEDHRLAMALAIAGLGAKGQTLIQGCHCIAKSFPTFVRDLNSIGAQLGLS